MNVPAPNQVSMDTLNLPPPLANDEIRLIGDGESSNVRDEIVVKLPKRRISEMAESIEEVEVANTAATRVVGNDDRWLTDRIVSIVVGAEERKWAVHERLLSNKSPYFNRVLNEDEAAKNCNELYLKDTSPKLFGMLLRWIYGTAFSATGGNRVFRYPIPDGIEYTVND